MPAHTWTLVIARHRDNCVHRFGFFADREPGNSSLADLITGVLSDHLSEQLEAAPAPCPAQRRRRAAAQGLWLAGRNELFQSTVGRRIGMECYSGYRRVAHARPLA